MNKSILTHVGLFLFGFFVCLFLLKADFTAHKEQIEVASSIISAVIAVVAVLVAIFGMYTWKKQFSYSRLYEPAAELERCFLEFLMATAREANLQGNDEILKLMSRITTFRFILMQRGFDVDILKKIEYSFRKAIQNAKETGHISKSDYEEIHAVYSEYSDTIEREYGTRNA
jgi:fumarate reductase subunit D